MPIEDPKAVPKNKQIPPYSSRYVLAKIKKWNSSKNYGLVADPLDPYKRIIVMREAIVPTPRRGEQEKNMLDLWLMFIPETIQRLPGYVSRFPEDNLAASNCIRECFLLSELPKSNKLTEPLRIVTCKSFDEKPKDPPRNNKKPTLPGAKFRRYAT